MQEDFIATGTETLDKLDEYIRQCDAVIHLVGDMTGARANPTAVAAIRQRYPDLAEGLPVLRPFLEPNAPALVHPMGGLAGAVSRQEADHRHPAEWRSSR